MKAVRPVGGRLGLRSSTARRSKPPRKRNATTQAAEGNLGGFCVEALISSRLHGPTACASVRHAIDEMVFAAGWALHEDEGSACRIRLSVPAVRQETRVIFLAAVAAKISHIVASSDRVRTAPVSSVYGCVRITDRARHRSGSSIGPTGACALAAWPPQKNIGTAPHPKEFHRTVVAGVPAPISGWLAVRAIRCHCGW